MDTVSRCTRCGKRLIPVPVQGRTELQCIWCQKVDPDPRRS